MGRFGLAAIVVAGTLLLSPAVNAEEGMVEASVEDVAALDGDIITRWVASLADIRPWGEANSDRFDSNIFNTGRPRLNPMSPPTAEDLERMRSPFSTAVEAARDVGVAGEVAGIVSQHGFSLDEWAETGDRIIRAYIAMQMQGGPDLQAKLDQTIAEMEENTRLSVAQKNKLISALMQTLDIFNLLSDAPAADIDAVRPLAELIGQTMAQ